MAFQLHVIVKDRDLKGHDFDRLSPDEQAALTRSVEILSGFASGSSGIERTYPTAGEAISEFLTVVELNPEVLEEHLRLAVVTDIDSEFNDYEFGPGQVVIRFTASNGYLYTSESSYYVEQLKVLDQWIDSSPKLEAIFARVKSMNA